VQKNVMHSRLPVKFIHTTGFVVKPNFSISERRREGPQTKLDDPIKILPSIVLGQPRLAQRFPNVRLYHGIGSPSKAKNR